MMKFLRRWSPTILGLGILCLVNRVSSDFQDPVVSKLFNLITDLQVKEDAPFIPYTQWAEQKGNYDSVVTLNTHGECWQAKFRRDFHVASDNIFIGEWVTIALLEAVYFGQAPKPSDQSLIDTIEFIRKAENKNLGYDNSIIAFYHYTYDEESSDYQLNPRNMKEIAALTKGLDLSQVRDFLTLGGFEDVANALAVAQQTVNIFSNAFTMPADADCTCSYLGMMSLLSEMKDAFPEAWERWISYDNNVTSVFDHLTRYAYRPFSDDSDSSTISPTSYFYLRSFLDQANDEGRDVILVNTWFESLEEQRNGKGILIPAYVNDIDPAVCANAVYSITASVLSGIVDPSVLDDSDLAQLYEDTAKFLAFNIRTGFGGRPDLALVYYSSQMQFGWWVGRTYAMLEIYGKNKNFPKPVMERVYLTLKQALEVDMTEMIMSQAHMEEGGLVYYEDFLGKADVTWDNKPLNRAEDRIFTTAMATNVLMHTWLLFDESSGKSTWKTDTSKKVKDLVMGGVNFLRKSILQENYEPKNAFFTALSRGFNTVPFWFPANRYERIDGTPIEDKTNIPSLDETFVLGVQGYIPKDQYDKMLQEPHFGVNTPLKNKGLNDPTAIFPVWQSKAYTYAVTLLAVSRFNHITENETCMDTCHELL